MKQPSSPPSDKNSPNQAQAHRQRVDILQVVRDHPVTPGVLHNYDQDEYDA